MRDTATQLRPFVSPARVTAGPGSSAFAGPEAIASGIRPAHGPLLLVADAAVLSLGLADPALESLRAAGFEVDVRPEVAGEPTPDTVRALLPADRDRRIAGVVAIGGGSALDAGKLVAAAHVNPIDLTAGLAATAEIAPPPPTIAVPTTAGTGAEATAVAMLWHEGGKRMFVHPHLVPRAALLDPELLSGLPAAVTAAGGLDAISHAVESLLSTFATALTEAAARAALESLSWAVPEAFESGTPEAREATLLGAFQAGLALNASVVLGHSLAYVIAARANLPHGVSCAMALPYCLAHARPAREREIDAIARLVCREEDADGGRLVAWLAEANERMGIPMSLKEVGIPASDLAAMAMECVESYPRPNHPAPIDVPALETLLGYHFEGAQTDAWNASRSLA